MNTYRVRPTPINRHWFKPVVEFLALRLLAGAAAGLIVYAGYQIFLQ
jgi:hypothetical protein